jgi:hypothetical protein
MAPKRLRLQYGYLKTLPDNFVGPRHTVTVRQIPRAWRTYSGGDWFEWEERPGPGPEPASNATSPSDEILVHVCYLEGKVKGSIRALAWPDTLGSRSAPGAV